MHKLKNKVLQSFFLSLLTFSFSVCALLAQTETSSPNEQTGIQKIENQLDDFNDSQKELLEKINKSLSPEQKKWQQQIHQANLAGDKKLADELTKKLMDSLQAKGGEQLQDMINFGLSSFKQMPDSQLHDLIVERGNQTLFGPILEQFPKITEFLVKALKDPIALPHFFSIIQQKKKLVIFLITNILLWIYALYVKKAHKKRNASHMTHFLRWIFFTSVRLGLFLLFFYYETSPLLHIFRRTFF